MRSKSGSYLIEALVAMTVGSMMAVSITALLGQTLQVTSATSNQMAADQIGKAVLDTMRGFEYSTLNSFVGQTFPQLQINKANGSTTTGPAPHSLALGLDSNMFQWTSLSVSNSFSGTGQIQVVPGPAAKTVLVSVTITWSDSEKLVPHSSTYSTLVTYEGENYWE
jgi:hypothetical protein